MIVPPPLQAFINDVLSCGKRRERLCTSAKLFFGEREKLLSRGHSSVKGSEFCSDRWKVRRALFASKRNVGKSVAIFERCISTGDGHFAQHVLSPTF